MTDHYKIKVSKAKQQEVKDLRAAGFPYREIVAQTGVNAHNVRCILDPNYRTARYARSKPPRKQVSGGVPKGGGSGYHASKADRDIDFVSLVSRVPEDTRGLTARICGDPLPGRSALDQKRLQHA